MAIDSRFFVGIGGRAVEIVCLNREARLLVCFLFADLLVDPEGEPVRRYEMAVDPVLQGGLVYSDGVAVQEGSSLYHTAYYLMNEVIEQCITGNEQHHALHAAAVRCGDCCIVLAGNSGAGKSTLTAWLVTRGFSYLTDELVLLDADRVIPFTRPINLKIPAPFLEPYCVRYDNLIIMSQDGTMIPYRLLGGSAENSSKSRQQVTHFLFPSFQEGESPLLEELSSAQCCLQLLQCHVNARNLEGLGVSSLARIVRNCRGYRLTYGRTADLEEIFAEERLASLFGVDALAERLHA
ncbi:hypothetical protein [Desulfofustis limnaeus]|jgi:hypothetical protein|uniref:Hpr(Ser) kinase/phosphatase n=1 Tax=Desulfofustis limnaeus TaxID=2740163 RepID=A0ABN6M4G4_9BACT|nr:hypothetical protein [Desulfofustis limnaeus]MDX9895385.1 hypothetical protein [Desulfofustis sp.]BDD87740.1 hypothetical protein DPPLL_21050 [Desulfofustis limnaeus]